MKAELKEMSDTAYHANSFSDQPFYSNSIGKIILSQSPMHAWLAHPKLNPNFDGDSEHKFAIGTAAHAAFLQGIDVCTVVDADDWRTKLAKEARDEAYLLGKIPVLPEQFKKIQDMVEAAHIQLADCADLGNASIADGKTEQTILLTDDDINIKVRVDWMNTQKRLQFDYKTTDVLNPGAWMRSISSLGYDMQDALYRQAGDALMDGGKPFKMVFLVQETSAPYAMYFVSLPNQYQEYGLQRTNRAITIWQNCIATGQWPAYSNRIMWPDLPPWVEGQWMESEAMIEDERSRGIVGTVSKEQFLFGKVR